MNGNTVNPRRSSTLIGQDSTASSTMNPAASSSQPASPRASLDSKPRPMRLSFGQEGGGPYAGAPLMTLQSSQQHYPQRGSGGQPSSGGLFPSPSQLGIAGPHIYSSPPAPMASQASPPVMAYQMAASPMNMAATSAGHQLYHLPASRAPPMAEGSGGGRAASLPGGNPQSSSSARSSRSNTQSSYNAAQMSALANLGLPANANFTAQQQQQPTSGSLMRPGSTSKAGPVPLHYSMGHHSSAISYERYTAELTNCIIAFLSPILPTEEEYRIKEATRRQLERLTSRVSPGAKLLAFGSMANGFALRHSDMDLVCLSNNGGDSPSASELVEATAKIIREETDFKVLALPKARIPIIKISRQPTSEMPYEIACDIGFENRLALENTRLLLSYAMVDP